MSERDERLRQCIEASGHDFSGAILVGGDYTAVARDGDLACVSGQVPRVGQTVMVTGRVGAETSLQQAQEAARICALRALVLLQRELRSLDNVQRILRMGVYVQSAQDFTQQSEVADAASGLVKQVMGEARVHARTSVGVFQLPKNASVEVEMTVRVSQGA